MKHFIKVFLVSLLVFSVVIFTGIYTYGKFFSQGNAIINKADGDKDNKDGDDTDYETPLEKAIHESDRINVLLMGLEGTRSDTIILASYDKKTKKANLISIPRDTYYPREGYSKYSEFMKINSIFGTEQNGYDALIEAVEDLTKIPIKKYVSIKYEGVRAAVDAVGGVEFDVPFRMKYTDPYDDPPLYINISAGNQIIYGDKAMELLRFRKGDPGYPGYPKGDVGRIKTQQDFIKAAVKKSLSLKLPSVISSVYPYVKTNFSLTDLLGLAGDAVGFSIDNLDTATLPGTAKYMGSPSLSFYIPDGEEITKMVYGLYGVPLTAETSQEYDELESKR